MTNKKSSKNAGKDKPSKAVQMIQKGTKKKVSKEVSEDTRSERDQFVELLKRRFGNVSEACSQFHIGRQTFYRWKEADPVFAEQVDDIGEVLKDLAESSLYRNITKGNVPSIIFYLKTKCRDRGYIERQDVAISSNSFGNLTQEELDNEIAKRLKRQDTTSIPAK